MKPIIYFAIVLLIIAFVITEAETRKIIKVSEAKNEISDFYLNKISELVFKQKSFLDDVYMAVGEIKEECDIIK